MKKTILLAAACTVAFAGCESMSGMGLGPGPKAAPGTAPAFDPRNPQVYVYSNDAANCAARKYTIVVDQEPVRFRLSGQAKAFPIIWHLQTSGYSFAKMPQPAPLQGSAPGEINTCHGGGNAMQCTNNDKNPGVWKYTISLSAADGCNPPDFDPYISND